MSESEVLPVGQRVRTDAEYARIDPFLDGDRDVDIRCRTVKIVTARRQRPCFGIDGATDHDILPGQRYRSERALVDGKWGHYAICLPCLDEWADDTA